MMGYPLLSLVFKFWFNLTCWHNRRSYVHSKAISQLVKHFRSAQTDTESISIRPTYRSITCQFHGFQGNFSLDQLIFFSLETVMLYRTNYVVAETKR